MCKNIILFLIFLGVLFASPDKAYAQQLAFPEAQGFGRFSTGGRGGVVYVVSNTNNSGTGSLRECITASGARTCVFTIGGTISLSSDLTISNDNITIAGQTAPGGGITLSGASLVVSADNVIIRYIRVRTGTNAPDPNQGDGIRVNGATDVIIDHCSFSWATDENTSAVNTTDLTYQWNIISEGLNTVGDSKGMLIHINNTNISVHHNLFAHNYVRNAQVAEAVPMEFINNLVYDYGVSVRTIALTGDTVNLDVVKNYFIAGVNTLDTRRAIDDTSTGGTASYYVEGNIDQFRTDDSQANSLSVDSADQGLISSTRFVTNTSITETSAEQAKLDVLRYAGANIPEQDSVDARIIQEAKELSGTIFSNPSSVGGYPTVSSGTAAADTDSDGMPDSWEDTYGLNKNDATDRNTDSDGDGYTNLEEYLNFTQPRQTTPWIQTDWFGQLVESAWKSIKNWFSQSGIGRLVQGEFSLDAPEEITNVGFNINTNNWSGIVESTAAQPDTISNLALWLKADAITGLNNNDAVTTWEDSSSTNRDAAQSTASLKPLYKTNQINSLPAISWDNVDDYLEFSALTASTYDVFFVYKRGVTGSDIDPFIGSNNGVTLIRQTSNGQSWDTQGDNSGYKAFTTSFTSDDGNWHIANFNFTSNTFNLRLDGKYRASNTATNSTYTFKRIGATGTAGDIWSGLFAEVIVYSQRLTEAQRLQVEKYLADKYGLTVQSGLSFSRTTSQAIETNLSVGSGTLAAPEGDGVIGQQLNLGDTITYNIIGYAKTDGSAVTSSDVQLYGNGSALTTTYTSVGSGWYKMQATVTGAATSKYYGAQIKAGKTVYVDRMSLSAYPDSGTLTSAIFDSNESSTDWKILTYTTSTPLDSRVEVRVRTGKNSNLSDALPFSTCLPISSGNDVSAGSCAYDGDRYAQYEVKLFPSSNPHTPTFSNFQLTYSGPPISGSSVASSVPGPQVCSSLPPGSKTPMIYAAIPISNKSLTLYFTEADKPFDRYYVQYGNEPGKYIYSGEFLAKEGMRTLTIGHLFPNRRYYFQIRAGNGCATGGWSNEFSANTILSSYLFAPVRSFSSAITPTPALVKEIDSIADKGYQLVIRVVNKKLQVISDTEVSSGRLFGKTDDKGEVMFNSVPAGKYVVDVLYQEKKISKEISLLEDQVQVFELDVNNDTIRPRLDWVFLILGILSLLLLIVLIGYKHFRS